MNVPLLVAGALALVGAGIHGVAGEALVVRKLSAEALPPTPFGGPGATKTMIRAAWHLTTIAFVTVGASLLAAGSFLEPEAARAVAVSGALASTAFATLVLGLGAASAPQVLRRAGAQERGRALHPAPFVLLMVVALAWTGVAAS